jgi:hypothetical protein
MEVPGALYHVPSRGHVRQKIFRDDADREWFWATLAWVVEWFGWHCYVDCLMGNHVPLLIDTPQPDVLRRDISITPPVGLLGGRYRGTEAILRHLVDAQSCTGSLSSCSAKVTRTI